MLISFYFFVGLYFVFLALAIFLWLRDKKSPVGSPKTSFQVSVIIAARNEENHIKALLESLENQDYPSHLLEIVVVNDHSEDGTAQIVEEYKAVSKHKIVLFHLDENSYTPKKEALKLGIQHSHGEILLFTDADCLLSSTWVSTMVFAFENKKIGLVVGPIRYAKGALLENMLSQEQAALLGTAFATLKLNIPTMCNGANLAVRRSTFLSVQGFESDSKTASGDDELLLHKVYLQDSQSVIFLKNKKAIVTTESASTLSQLYQQRKRWAGKWEKYLMFRTKAFALFIFSFHAMWISAAFCSFFSPSFALLFACMLALKCLLEFVFIFKVMQFLGKKINLFGFLFWQLLYSPYVVFFGLVSRGKKYHWKGRNLQ